MEPLLVGVTHEMLSLELLDQHCKLAFQEEVAPHVRANSLLIFENGYTRTIYRPHMWSYRLKHRSARSLVGGLREMPALTWRDPRNKWQNFFSGVMKDFAAIFYIKEQITPLLTLHEGSPTRSFEELLVLIKNGQLIQNISRKLSDLDKLVIRDLAASLDRFDEEMFTAVNEWKESGRIFIITGATHSISMHLKTGWPIIYLNEFPGLDQNIITGAAEAFVLPKLIT